jgi:hypothetical protein
MTQFRNIQYSRMLIDTLSSDLSFNSDGSLTWFYKYCACCLQPLVAPFAAFVTFRNTEALIAQCAYQIGQLTNVLNYLFDPVNNTITISRAVSNQPAIDDWAYPAKSQLTAGWTDPAKLQTRGFTDAVNTTGTLITIPPYVDQSALVAVVEQIRLEGLTYSIVVS